MWTLWKVSSENVGRGSDWTQYIRWYQVDIKLKAGYVRWTYKVISGGYQNQSWIYKVISGGYQSFLSRVAHQCRSRLPFGVSSVAQLSQVSPYRRRRQLTFCKEWLVCIVKNICYIEVPHTSVTISGKELHWKQSIHCILQYAKIQSTTYNAPKTINTLHNIPEIHLTVQLCYIQLSYYVIFINTP